MRPTVTTPARSTALGAAWNYSAQIATVVIQLGYAAISSRLLPPSAFGQYGVALVISGLVTLLATAGLPQAVSRMHHVDGSRLTGLLIYALGVGGAGALFLVLTADAWAALWDIRGAEGLLRLLAIGAFFAPASALGAGAMLRRGRFRTLALVTFLANVGGMAVGLVIIEQARVPEALVVSAIAAQGITALALLALSRQQFHGRPRWRLVVSDLTYSGGMTVSSILSYSAGNVGKFALSKAFGAAFLGNWNRAEVLTLTPFYQIQYALIQALYPEFRHDIGGSIRAHRVWADVLGLVAWLCIPASSALAVALPVLIPVLFGPGWSTAALVAPVLAIMGGVQATTFVLVAALEVLARFRWIWAGYLVGLAVNVIGGVAALAAKTFVPVLVSSVLALVCMHALHVALCHRVGLLDVRRLLRHYSSVVAFSCGLAAIAWILLHLPHLSHGRPWLPFAALLGFFVATATCWQSRARLAPLRLAKQYGIRLR